MQLALASMCIFRKHIGLFLFRMGSVLEKWGTERNCRG